MPLLLSRQLRSSRGPLRRLLRRLLPLLLLLLPCLALLRLLPRLLLLLRLQLLLLMMGPLHRAATGLRGRLQLLRLRGIKPRGIVTHLARCSLPTVVLHVQVGLIGAARGGGGNGASMAVGRSQPRRGRSRPWVAVVPVHVSMRVFWTACRAA